MTEQGHLSSKKQHIHAKELSDLYLELHYSFTIAVMLFKTFKTPCKCRRSCKYAGEKEMGQMMPELCELIQKKIDFIYNKYGFDPFDNFKYREIIAWYICLIDLYRCYCSCKCVSKEEQLKVIVREL